MTATILSLEATSRTPAITLSEGMLIIEGESYPEDVKGFYASVQQALAERLEALTTAFKVEIKLIYFNSSTARLLMQILAQLETYAKTGKAITLHWYCDPDDDITREFAEDISEDLEKVDFALLDAS